MLLSFLFTVYYNRNPPLSQALQIHLFIAFRKIRLKLPVKLRVFRFFQVFILRKEPVHVLGDLLKRYGVRINIGQPKLHVAALAQPENVPGAAQPQVLGGDKKPSFDLFKTASRSFCALSPEASTMMQ